MPSVPGTLLSLQNEIASDLGRSDLLNDIRNAIIDAVEELSGNKLYFNVTRTWYFNTIQFINSYELGGFSAIGPGVTSTTQFPIDEFIQVDNMWIKIGNVWTRMSHIDPEDIEFVSQNSGSYLGQPISWSHLDDAWNDFRITPTPNAVYNVRVMGHFRHVPLADDADTNDWLGISNAYYCVKARAKAQVFAEKIRNPKEAQINMAAAQERLDALYRATTRMAVSGYRGSRIRAHG